MALPRILQRTLALEAQAQSAIFPGICVPFKGTFGGANNVHPINPRTGTADTKWRLCDGGGGTPDLRDKFILGASATHASGTTGGVASHAHTATGTLAINNATAEGTVANKAAAGTIASATAAGTVANTTLTANQMPKHAHAHIQLSTSSLSQNQPAASTSGGFHGNLTDTAGASAAHNHGFTGTAHTHTFTGTNHNHTFTGTAHSHTGTAAITVAASDALPPFYAMAYITPVQ